MASFTLNVLIHGMYLIDIGGHNVMLYPPKVPNDAHIYMAGTWKKEEPLEEGSRQRLTGFARHSRPALSALHAESNAVFHRAQPDLSQAYCSIEVPFPDTIATLRLTREKSDVPFFQGSPNLYQAPNALPDVIVLTYNNVDGEVKLKPLGWTPETQNGIANLHLWATPPGPTPPGHPEAELQVIGKMMGYPNLRMNLIYKEQPAPSPDLDTGVPGVTSDEELSYFERQSVGGDAGLGPRISSSFDCVSLIVY